MKPQNRGHSRARRRFLQSGALVAGGLVIAACGSNEAANRVYAEPKADDPKKDEPQKSEGKLVYGALLCGGRLVNTETNEERFVFTQLSIDQTLKNRAEKIPLIAQKLITDIGFLPHGVIKNPTAPHKVLVFEKKGRGGAEIDLKENKVINRIEPGDGRAFYGHGAYSTDHKVIYATQYDEETYEGTMVLRDATDFKVIGDFPTHGEWPHDCQFIDDGKTVAITNGGGNIKGGAAPNVSYVNVADGKLIEKIEFDNAAINAGHLIISDHGDLAVGHAMREGLDTREALGGLSIRPKNAKFKTMVTPAEVTGAMKGETLSLCMLHDKKIVAATNPYGRPNGIVTFWNYETQKYVDKLEIEQPRGVALTLDNKYWIVTFGKDTPGFILLSTETNQPEDPPVVFAASSQGSHVYIHDYYAD
ncbi:MAG: DUF1513 domain-containing protein [Planctomycetes bacterium]|nr:DUF1513 domain-containing protein [Planctomycetota bacterium]